jgi:hypothetical protein
MTERIDRAIINANKEAFAIVRTMGFSLLVGKDEPGEPASQFRIIIQRNGCV